MPTVGDQLLNPESGWQRIESSDSRIFKPNYVTQGNTSASGGSYTYIQNASNAPIKLKFFGTKLRIICYVNNGSYYSTNAQFWVDGIQRNTFSLESSAIKHEVIVAEILNLNLGYHTAEIKVQLNDTKGLNLDAIDIDSTGQLVEYNEVFSVNDLTVGKKIKCDYSSFSSTMGLFYNLGTSTSTQLATSSSLGSPKGSFYFIHLYNDYKDRKVLIADRNIQTNFNWNVLNTNGLASSTGLELKTRPEFTGTKIVTINRDQGFRSVIPRVALKWYVEVKINQTSAYNRTWIGIGNNTVALTENNFQADPLSFAYRLDGSVTRGGSITSAPSANVQVGDIIGMHLDLENGSIAYYKNNVLLTTITGVTVPRQYYFTCAFTNSAGLNVIEINLGDSTFNYALPNDYKPYQKYPLEDDSNIYTVRLPSGGVSSTDLDNEWDRYIVNSSLNGEVLAGSTSIWNWATSSWTLNTNVTSNFRVIRGGAANNTYAEITSSNLTGSVGFRPVLIVETNLISYKVLFSNNGSIYDWNGSSFVVIGSAPVTESLFSSSILEASTLASIPSSAWSVFSGPVELHYYTTDSSVTNKSFTYTGTPISKVLIPTSDFSIPETGLVSVNIAHTLSGSASVKVVASIDSGTTWKAFSNGTWNTVSSLTVSDVSTNGMTLSTLNGLTQSQWSLLVNKKNKIRLAYAIITSESSDQIVLDQITLNHVKGDLIEKTIVQFNSIDFVSNDRVTINGDANLKTTYSVSTTEDVLGAGKQFGTTINPSEFNGFSIS